MIRTLRRFPSALTFATMAGGAALGLASLTWAGAPALLAFTALTLAAALAGIVDPQRWTTAHPVTPLSFVFECGALLYFGPGAMTYVAVAASLAHSLCDPPWERQIRRPIVNTVVVIAATQAAGFAHVALGGMRAAPLAWPWQALPIGAAVLAWCVVRHVVSELLDRSAERRTVAERVFAALTTCPPAIVAAALAVFVLEIVNRDLWALLPVVAAPIYLACRGSVEYVERIESDERRRRAIERLDRPLAIVAPTGRILAWNDAVARLLDCPPERAIGRPLADAVPALARTSLPRAIDDAIRTRGARTVGNLHVTVGDVARVLKVEIAPEFDGVVLRCDDAGEHVRNEQELRRVVDRLALAVEGANDGLWEWDLRTQELYVSARWCAILGLPPRAATMRREEWLDRIHGEDREWFEEALEEHLAHRVDHIQRELRVRHEDGTYRRFLWRAVADCPGRARAVRLAGSLTDLSDGAIVQERIRSAEVRDPLTGLCNRAAFVERLGDRLSSFKQRRGGGRFAVLYLDLDRFKVVNDSLGHLVGDELLTAVSRRLESCLRPNDALARLGGDEFAILLNGLGDATQANAIAFRIQETLGAPFAIAGREVVASASIGIAFSRAEYTNPEEMMRDADTAMYHAKAHGKARHELFDADMHARELDRLGLEGDLRTAVKNHAFEVHYQPIVTLATGMCAGFESLVRWNRNGHMVSPIEFIPLAEELGLIDQLGTWVLQEACRTFAAWQKTYPALGLEYITVNVSARQLTQQGFVLLVEQAVEESGLKPASVRLEITETALMDAPHFVAQVLRDLRNFGVKIYLDDFGTGFSSLSHLHKLPVDALKIDRSFVRSLTIDDRPAIVESILALAHTLHTSVVAEGIETELQSRELQRLGCGLAQGYYFSPPIPAAAVEDVLRAGRPLGGSRVQAVVPPVAVRDDRRSPVPAGADRPPTSRTAPVLASVRAVRARSRQIA